ncbi:MAG: hypothetical protein WA138_07455 [Parvibaculum sp.]
MPDKHVNTPPLARTFMGASVVFRLGIAAGCIAMLWLCVGWAISL